MLEFLKKGGWFQKLPAIAFLLVSVGASSLARADDYDLIDSYPSRRILQQHYPFDFSWSLSKSADSLELRLYRLEADREILLDSANLAGYRTSLKEFGGTLPVGKYRWVLTGFVETQAKPIFTKQTSFTIEPHNPNNSEYSKLGLMLGYSQGEFSSANQNSGLSFRSSRSFYGFFVEIPVQNKFFIKGSAFAQEYNVLGEFSRVAGYNLDLSYGVRIMDQRILLQPGLRIGYYYVPEVQYFIDAFDERSTLKGQTNAMTYGPVVTASYGISRDWFAQLEVGLERQFKSVGTIWHLDAPNSKFSYNVDFSLRGLWFWPFELGFRAGYRNLSLGQTGYGMYSQVGLSDVRFTVQLAYLFGNFF